MSRSINRATILGYIGSVDELVYLGKDKTPKLGFSIATQYSKEAPVQWHRMSIWGDFAKTMSEYLEKGRQVYCEGEIRYITSDEKTEVKRYFTDINVTQLVLLGGVPKSAPKGIPDEESSSSRKPTNTR